MSLDKKTALKIYEGLKYAYRPVESRMEVGKNNLKEFDTTDIVQHVLTYDVPFEWENKVTSWSNVEEEIKIILDPFISKALSIIKEKTKSYQYIFFILSTNLCGKKRHVKHLHTILQKDPPRNITFSIPIPLYIDDEYKDSHKFYWHYTKNLYPKITYTSHVRMENLNVTYNYIDIPKKISSLLFDSTRTIHYIDNTPHMYLWVVCDGVELHDRNCVEGVELISYDNF